MIFTKDFLRGAAEGRVSLKDGGGIPMPRETAAKENPVSQQKTPASAGGIQDQMAYQVFTQPDSPGAALGAAIGNAVAQQLRNDPDRYKGWLQKGAFEDGYQFGDVTKTAVATGRDLGGNLLTGVAGIGEKAVDALLFAAPYAAQGQYYQNGGIYQPLEAQQAQNRLFEQSKKVAADLIAKDLYDERAVADTILQNSAFERETGIDIRKNSVMGDKADALAQSGGQLLGTAGLKLLGIPAELTIFATSFGGEAENALNQGASMEEAGISAAISAGTELLTEKFSDGIKLIGGKTLTEAMKKKLAQAISNKTVRTLIGLGLDTVGEGFEEVAAEVVHAVGQKLTYASEKEMKELLTRESLWDAFIGGTWMGSVSTAGKVATGNYRTGWDGREAVVEATGPSITVDGKKYRLLGYDAKGSPVYEDARVVQEQEASGAGKRDVSTTLPQESVANLENDDKMRIGLQFFAKKSEDYSTVILERKEYAHVMSEIATNLTKEQAKMRTFSKAIGEYIYVIENNGFGNYRIIKKRKIRRNSKYVQRN